MLKKALILTSLIVGLISLTIVPAFATFTDQTTSDQTTLVCMQNAVGARENALIAAFGTYASNTEASLSDRNTGLIAAWKISDDSTRKNAILNTWFHYRKAISAAHRTMRQDRIDSFYHFRLDNKVCNPTNQGSLEGRESSM